MKNKVEAKKICMVNVMPIVGYDLGRGEVNYWICPVCYKEVKRPKEKGQARIAIGHMRKRHRLKSDAETVENEIVVLKGWSKLV